MSMANLEWRGDLSCLDETTRFMWCRLDPQGLRSEEVFVTPAPVFFPKRCRISTTSRCPDNYFACIEGVVLFRDRPVALLGHITLAKWGSDVADLIVRWGRESELTNDLSLLTSFRRLLGQCALCSVGPDGDFLRSIENRFGNLQLEVRSCSLTEQYLGLFRHQLETAIGRRALPRTNFHLTVDHALSATPAINQPGFTRSQLLAQLVQPLDEWTSGENRYPADFWSAAPAPHP
jgi:hypothetical protein